MNFHENIKHLPSKRNYVQFALFSIGLLWVSYFVEMLTPLRIGHGDREAMSLLLPAIGTPLVALCTWWRFHRATNFALGAVEVPATILKIARSSTGPHKRVRLGYEFEGRTYERSFPLYNSVVDQLEIGSQIPILVLRHSPKRIEVPMNMDFLG